MKYLITAHLKLDYGAKDKMPQTIGETQRIVEAENREDAVRKICRIDTGSIQKYWVIANIIEL